MSRSRSIVASVVVLLAALTLVFVAPGCGGSKKTTAPTAAMATVTGAVTDALAGTALSAASVKASSGATATTDANGRFTVSIPANQNVRIDVTRSDHSLNQIVLKLAAGETRALSVSLIPAGTTSAVATSAGGKVTDAGSGATLSLPANFVTTAGNVNVRVTGLDPTTTEVKALPGGLDAIDANGHAVYLKPVSFAEYTVTDASGNVLQFNPSASSGANIELPIPASLRGQPGYQNGDPIECYVYDPSDGKWKTPVPGVVGASSVDGTTPAIKATIFHLSWYGGAPATSQISCVEGTVTLNGTPVAGANVEAFPGSNTVTDANGHYQLQAQANSTVRVDASILSGTNFRTAEGSVAVPASGTTCAHLDLALGAATAGQYTVNGSLGKVQSSPVGQPFMAIDLASVTVEVGVASSHVPVTGANVQIGTGTTWFTLADEGSGDYGLYTGQSGFVLNPGANYTLRVDFTNDGTWDATSTIPATGVPIIATPADSSTVGKSFTTTWTDAGSAVNGYSAVYFGEMGSDSGAALFATSQRSYVVGNGVTDPVTHLPNGPLSAGSYTYLLSAGRGPIYDPLIGGSPAPNVTGTNVTGDFYSLSIGTPYAFTCTGAIARLAARRSALSPWQPPVTHTAAIESARSAVKQALALAHRRLAAQRHLRAAR